LDVGDVVVAGCAPPSLFASLSLGGSFGGFVAGELVVAAVEGETPATESRAELSWEKSREPPQRKKTGRYTRVRMGRN
jgi:hypothetical protein